MNHWKTIWNAKTIEASDNVLETLLRADGYDTAFGKLDETHFSAIIKNISESLDIKKNDSLYEVGCGAGAVLYPFHKEPHRVAGLDYSAPLIDLAQKVMPEMVFELKEADHLDEQEKFDIVFSFGVFIYFKNFDYAETVLRKMISKAKKAVGIFDISDLALKNEAQKLRREEMGAQEYEKRYKGLTHLYYPKSFFQDIAKELNWNIRIRPQSIGGYKNSFYRYNVIFSR